MSAVHGNPPAVSVDRFFTRLNPLIAGILRSRFHWLLSRGLALLTVTGRRSGRRFSFPVGYQRDGTTLTVMVSEAHRKTWWRNYLEPGPVEVVLRGKRVAGRAQRIPPETDAFQQAAERTLRRMPWLARVFRVEYDRSSGLSAEQIEHLRGEIAAVRIDLEPEAGSSA